MLERLDDTCWSDYTDFYARSATVIPDLIRQLHIEDPAQHAAALHDIFDRICHQASTKDLTVQVIPFLVDLLTREAFSPKPELIGQLRTLAIGLDSDELHDMLKISDRVAALEQDPDAFYQADVQLGCYEGVRNAVPDLVSLLDDSTQATRIQSTYTLAWFPADCELTLPSMQRKLSASMDDIELSNLLLSIGLLEFHSSTPSPNRRFVEPMLDSDRKLMRYTSGIYMDWHFPSDRSTKILHEIRDDEEFEPHPVQFNSGMFWFQYAESRLEKLGNGG